MVVAVVVLSVVVVVLYLEPWINNSSATPVQIYNGPGEKVGAYQYIHVADTSPPSRGPVPTLGQVLPLFGNLRTFPELPGSNGNLPREFQSYLPSRVYHNSIPLQATLSVQSLPSASTNMTLSFTTALLSASPATCRARLPGNHPGA